MYRSKRLEIALLFSLSFCAGLLFASLLAVTAFVFIHAFVGRERARVLYFVMLYFFPSKWNHTSHPRRNGDLPWQRVGRWVGNEQFLINFIVMMMFFMNVETLI